MCIGAVRHQAWDGMGPYARRDDDACYLQLCAPRPDEKGQGRGAKGDRCPAAGTFHLCTPYQISIVNPPRTPSALSGMGSIPRHTAYVGTAHIHMPSSHVCLARMSLVPLRMPNTDASASAVLRASGTARRLGRRRGWGRPKLEPAPVDAHGQHQAGMHCGARWLVHVPSDQLAKSAAPLLACLGAAALLCYLQ